MNGITYPHLIFQTSPPTDFYVTTYLCLFPTTCSSTPSHTADMPSSNRHSGKFPLCLVPVFTFSYDLAHEQNRLLISAAHLADVHTLEFYITTLRSLCASSDNHPFNSYLWSFDVSFIATRQNISDTIYVRYEAFSIWVVSQ